MVCVYNTHTHTHPSTMDTETIANILYKELGQDVFKGVHPASKLPVVGGVANNGGDIKHPFCFVANTECINNSGQHWVAFYFDRRGAAHYFDSFGRQPLFMVVQAPQICN